MPSSEEFWKYYDESAAPHLRYRSESFRWIFAHLDRLDRPVGIVETGCVRRNDWDDGRSTVLFSKYAEYHPGSVVYSVDLDPAAIALCRSAAGERARVHCGDSVAFLKSLSDSRPADLIAVDLLYLDSYDVSFESPLPSAIHHLKELTAVTPLISADTLVVVDDSPVSVLGVQRGRGRVQAMSKPLITGKGKLIAEYAAQVGGRQVLSEYQVGWIGLGRPVAA
jgi:hypothetical protein